MARPIRKPKGTDPAFTRSRRRGVLLGLAVGDSLGATLDNRRFQAPPFPALCDGPHREMRPGGPYELKIGQVTDETQLAVVLHQSLRELGRYDATETALRYQRWRPFGVGVPERLGEAIDALRPTMPFLAAQELWLRQNKRLSESGSLARTAPIGVGLAKSGKDRTAASLHDSALTHFDPRCQLACAAFNAAIATGVLAPSPPKAEALWTAARIELAAASAELGRLATEFIQETRNAAEMLRKDLDLAQGDDPLLYGPELHLHTMASDVRVAFRLAFWELLHAGTFEEALVDVVNRGGDTDANGAITGALLGSLHGEEGIPSEWSRQVLEALGGPLTQAGVLWTVYHPARMLSLEPE